MDRIETRYAGRNVPRYTSYPTAPHFGADVDGETYAKWLGSQPESGALSLYIHVPFCREICHYCGCHTRASRQDGPIADYAETLIKEIELVSRALRGSRSVTHLHWGGGTPSLLPRQSFQRIVSTLGSCFDLTALAEHAIELDPRVVTRDLASTLADIGVTRVSLGVQDLDADVQKEIGRIQPLSTVSTATDVLRSVGIDAINFDLMYGLPGQTVETISRTVNEALALAPSRIALFGYAHVPWMKKNQRLINEALLPGLNARRALNEAARTLLCHNGYEAIGMDHFARSDDPMAIALRDGKLHRNFQGYTCDTAERMLGFGVSSIGQLENGYIQNIADVNGWRARIEEDRLPVARGLELTQDDKARAAIISSLMTDYAVDIHAEASRFGLSMTDLADAFDRLDEFISDGLVEVQGDRLAITPAGHPFVRVVAAAFDRYLQPEVARHSVAV